MEEYVYSVQRKGLGPSNTRSYMNYISTPQLGFADIRREAAKTAKISHCRLCCCFAAYRISFVVIDMQL